jgi:1,4-dihydroxy-2-naphthoate octaprenyltransferase
MVLGSLYLHARAVSWSAFAASLVPACFIMALAVVNAIPDFHQDRLVGKRNLVVRAGRENAVYLYLGLAGAGLAVIVMGVIARAFTPWTLAALAAIVPVVASGRCALRNFSSPRQFLPAMRSMVVAYIVVTGLFTAAIFMQSFG